MDKLIQRFKRLLDIYISLKGLLMLMIIRRETFDDYFSTPEFVEDEDEIRKTFTILYFTYSVYQQDLDFDTILN